MSQFNLRVPCHVLHVGAGARKHEETKHTSHGHESDGITRERAENGFENQSWLQLEKMKVTATGERYAPATS